MTVRLLQACRCLRMIVADWRQMGTVAHPRVKFNRLVSTAVRSTVQCCRTHPGALTASAALLGCTSWILSQDSISGATLKSELASELLYCASKAIVGDPKEWTWGTEDIRTYLKEKLDHFSEWDDKVFGDSKLEIEVKRWNTGEQEVKLQYMDTPFTMDTFRENLHQKGIGAEASYDIIHCLQRLWTIPKEPKVFNDPIHGHIEIPPLLVRIIDTPEFQRLRNIKQLSGTYMVFPGASHNRFEHSLGVAYLAGELVKTLQEKQPKLKITKRDVLCVQIAGLCHDLGHGPFSHLYDGLFMNLLKEQKDPEEKKERSKKWTHEVASVKMLEHLVVKNHLEGVFWLSDLGDFQDALDFIGRLIMGGPIKEGEKDFLFQIVANKENGVDVDKWDYFARDSYYLGIGTSFDHRRLLKFVRVCTAIEDGKKHICYREKEAGNLYNMFYTRHLLHCRAYQHPVKNIIDHMIAEAFVAANDHFDIKGSQESSGSQNPQKISTAMNDMEAYAKLTDSVFDQILQSDEPGLKQAKKILQRVTCRELYHFIGESPPYKLDTISKDKLVKDMVSEVQEKNPELEFSPQDIVVHVITANYGNNSEDPLTNVYFYNKMDKRRAKKKEMDSLLLPQTFGEQVFRLYCKKRASLDAVKTAWKEILKNIKNGNLEK